MQIYTETDNELIKNIKEKNDEESLKALIGRHSPLCHSLYKKYSIPLNSSGVYMEDLTSQKDYIIYKSALSFDPDRKSKFSTWLYNQVRYQCLNCINDNKPYVKLEDLILNKLIDDNSNVNYYQDKHNEDLNEYIYNILNYISDKRIAKIFKLRYSEKNKKMPWSKIAKSLKISTQTAINLHNKTLKVLKFKLKSDNLFDKF